MAPAPRRRQTSISLSRSTPNLASLDSRQAGRSPSITVDEGTPRSPRQFILPGPNENHDAGSGRFDDEDVDDAQSHQLYNRSRSSSSSSSSSASSPAPVLARSQSYANLTTFAPPFYNRPPMPLPPSPSLTSLLRPSFSTTTSRPTTPDDSENDTPNDTEAAVAKSAYTATTVPRASPKVPTYEYYGFVLYLTSYASFLIYVLWSYLPSPFLHQLGIYYYPNRWWSLAIPAFLVALIVYIYVALACYNTEVLTLPIGSLGTFVDEAANVAVLDEHGNIKRASKSRAKPEKENRSMKGRKERGSSSGKFSQPGLARPRDWRNAWNEGTDAVMDVPIGGVCEILFGSD